jgi:hypothetical protein
MEAITGAVKNMMSALTPKKNESPLLKTVPPPTKNMKLANQIAENVKMNLKKNEKAPEINMNANRNNNNINAGNVRFEPGGRQNLYSMFQSSASEGGGRRKTKRQTKKHRKSKKRTTRRS